ncbi:DUF418 domain-containing protein [Temperatibacter marinus]|uniref:DUF418 domain-containing protein n=1 Tax=Temperatibacter marinus TaxID=1456591 RepID=A0AA52EC34_9PROT|nr:DUF418 domain-containing protein [Temperatibacter marinus]WND02642.1 DUF418 domain-containing protein [Temperatibacter marinus]
MSESEAIDNSVIPTQKKDRIASLDVARGVAVLGILACNIWAFGWPIYAWRDMGMMGLENYHRESFIAMMQFLDGTQRGIFSMLFGVGTVLFMERMAKRGIGIEGADIFFRRTVILFVFGLMNAFVFMWFGDILFHYAAVTFIIYGLRNAKLKTLVSIILFIMVFNMGIKSLSYLGRTEAKAGWEEARALQKEGKELTSEQTSKLKEWYRRTDTERTAKRAQDQIDTIRSGFGGTWTTHASWSVKFETTYFYYGFFFDVLIMMFLGIILYRIGLFSRSFSKKKLAALAVILIGLGSAWRFVKVSAIWGTGFGEYDALASAGFAVFEQPTRLILSVGYLSAILFLCRLGRDGIIKKAFAATGQMALTNYLSQSIICAFLFYGFGYGLYGQLYGLDLMTVVGVIWAIQLIWSPLWLKRYRYGPFEWVWRSLTYGQKQPMKR